MHRFLKIFQKKMRGAFFSDIFTFYCIFITKFFGSNCVFFTQCVSIWSRYPEADSILRTNPRKSNIQAMHIGVNLSQNMFKKSRLLARFTYILQGVTAKSADLY